MPSVNPTESFECVLDAGETGLLGTVGLLIVDNQGATVQAFSTAFIIETPLGSGVYAATRTGPATAGQYTIVWTRGPGGETLGVEDLLVTGAIELDSIPVIPDDFPIGPCATWIDGDDVAACCDTEVGSNTSLLEAVAQVASGVMFELSGRVFSGRCQRTVRPCREACGCWATSRDVFWYGGAGYWRSECGPQCGCGPLSTVRLAGYPVREIVEVKIDGVAVAPSGYRLDGKRDLVRLDDPGPPVVARSWPGCQNLALADDQPGTFAVTYTWGLAPPALGRDAAAQLACELWKACPGNEGTCKLPGRVTRVVRQGVTYEKALPLAELLRAGATGLAYIDTFVAVYGSKARRRPAVWSPDIQPFAREAG